MKHVARCSVGKHFQTKGLWYACLRMPFRIQQCAEVVPKEDKSLLEGVACLAGSQEGPTPGAAARARQLADVSLFIYEAGGTTIHLPLESSHALVAVLKKALEREGKERPGKEWVVNPYPHAWARYLCQETTSTTCK